MVDSSETNRNPVEELAEQFMDRVRAGEAPSIEEYVQRHPELADEIRSMFAALAVVEDLKPARGDESTIGAESGFAAPPSLPEIPEYRLFREIGRGGMGIVYEAEHLSLGRRVALKVLPAGPRNDEAAVMRFRQEARVAAAMHHSNIVPVFDVGQTEQYNYYAMQYIVGDGLDRVVEVLREMQDRDASGIDGQRDDVSARVASALTTHLSASIEAPGTQTPSATRSDETATRASVTTSSLTALQTRRAYFGNVARIGVEVARALEHAHERGIIHRDIKPSNILLDTEGTAWVADFGLAKAEDVQLTQTGNILGTLRYMSPERFSGTCDPPGDVYGLGATLYEMLALKPIFPGDDQLALIDSIKTEPPELLRVTDRSIPVDLATIVHKALEKNVGRRYATAQQMADDLQRFLDGRPIRARRTGPLERLGLWARNNRAIAALLLTVLLGLAGATVASSVVAVRFKNLAEQETRARKSAESVREFLVDTFASVEPDADGVHMTVFEVFERELPYIEEEFKDDPYIQADLLSAFGDVLEGLGEFKAAARASGKAVEVLDTPQWESERLLVESLIDLHGVSGQLGLRDELFAIAERARELALTYHADDASLLLQTNFLLGSANYFNGKDEKAVSYYEQAVAEARVLWGNDNVRTLGMLTTLGGALEWVSRKDEGRALLREVYETTKRIYGPDDYTTANAAERLLYVWPDTASAEEYAQLKDLVLRVYQRELSEDHPKFLALRRHLARRMLEQGKGNADECIRELKEIYEIEKEQLGESNVLSLYSLGEIARGYMLNQQPAEALSILEKVYRMGIEAGLAQDPQFLRLHARLATVHSMLEDYPRAMEVYEEVYANAGAALGSKHRETVEARRSLGDLYLQLAKFGEAAELIKQTVEVSSELYGPSDANTLNQMTGLIRSLLHTGDYTHAGTVIEDLFERIKQAEQDEEKTAAFAHFARAQVCLATNRTDEAILEARQSIKMTESNPGLETLTQLARIWHALANLSLDSSSADDLSTLSTTYHQLRDKLEEMPMAERWMLFQASKDAAAVFRKHGDEQLTSEWAAKQAEVDSAIRSLSAP